MYLLARCSRPATARARATLRRCVLCHVTYDAMGPPLSARVLSRDRAALSHDRSRDCVARVLFRINCPPPPGWPVYGGVSVGSAVCHGPGAISMKEDWVQGAPSHSQTSYAGTRAFMRHRARLPATVVVARGLLSPMPWFSAAFYCRGFKGFNLQEPLPPGCHGSGR